MASVAQESKKSGYKGEDCIKCTKMFDCKGMPRPNMLCLHFYARKDEKSCEEK